MAAHDFYYHEYELVPLILWLGHNIDNRLQYV